MKKTAGYEINYAGKEIIITKSFKKAAGVYGSKDYEIMTGLRKDFPDYEIVMKTIEKKENKISYNGLTIYKMQAYIQLFAGKEEFETFKKHTSVYDGQKGKYATLKKIFLNSYKEGYASLTVNEMAEVDGVAKELKEKAEKVQKTEIVKLPEATTEMKNVG